MFCISRDQSLIPKCITWKYLTGDDVQNQQFGYELLLWSEADISWRGYCEFQLKLKYFLNILFDRVCHGLLKSVLMLTWKKRSIWGCRLTIGSLTGSTSLKQMIVTAAQAIMRHTLTMKKKCRNLSRREHSGNLQWEIWKLREQKNESNLLYERIFGCFSLPQTFCGANTDIGTIHNRVDHFDGGRKLRAISAKTKNAMILDMWSISWAWSNVLLSSQSHNLTKTILPGNSEDTAKWYLS